MFDLLDGDKEDAEFASRTLKTMNVENDKTVVLVSSVITWAKSKHKKRPPNDEEREKESADKASWEEKETEIKAKIDEEVEA